jgi:calcineurin-like phosphoesterase family protein
MEKVFFISDTHFLHKNIVGYTDRPQEHNKIMFDNWNKVVGKNDYVFHLGDFSAGVGKVENGYEKLKKISKNLNGKKILIRGNHDHYSDSQYINDFAFESVHDFIIYKDFFLCHYPLIIDKYTKGKDKPMLEYLIKEFKNSNKKYLVHGHSHRKKFGYPRINIAVEQISYTPVLETQLLNLV